MLLDSVREVKSTVFRLLSEFSVRQETNGQRIRALQAGAIGGIGHVALGIATGNKRGDYRLALRSDERTNVVSELIAQAEKLTHGEVDVRITGPIKASAKPWMQERVRPLEIGCSIGHYASTAGTLGCFVSLSESNKRLILSNNHVLASCNRGQRQDPILQPAPEDGGLKPENTIGRLRRRLILEVSKPNIVDAALSTVSGGLSKANIGMIRGLGRISSPLPIAPDLDMPVVKLGRTTGITKGRISALELDGVSVEYGTVTFPFDRVIEIEGEGTLPFSRPGDSGSLILTDGLEPVALLFAGSDQGGSNGQGLTYANPLSLVLDALGVKILC